MVRFNDKTAITSSQISSDDILPITDLSASSDDKKISLGQIGEFVANNSNVAHKNLDNSEVISDAIIASPNGIFVASNDNASIIVKEGLTFLIADGRTSDYRLQTINYEVESDITQSIITLADGEYSLFVNSSGAIVYADIDDVWISRTEPEIPSGISRAYWYDVQTNYWKTTTNQGSTWSNQSICQLGFFVIENALVSELKPNTLAYIPNSEYIMVRDLSNITDNGKKLLDDLSALSIYSSTTNYKEGKWVLYNSKIYESLTNNNIGHLPTDTTYWKEIELGGGSGEWGSITGTLSNQTDLNTALNGKVSTSDLVEVNPMITSYVSGKSGYNIWANGYCEMWGNVTCTSSETDKTISFLKTFADTNYNVSISGNSTYSSSSNVIVTCLNMWSSKNTNSMVIKTYRSNYMNSYDWKVSGYLASGQY